MSSQRVKCETCAYITDVTYHHCETVDKVAVGECHRFPPMWIGGNLTRAYRKHHGVTQAMFDCPTVLGSDFCGEWKESNHE